MSAIFHRSLSHGLNTALTRLKSGTKGKLLPRLIHPDRSTKRYEPLLVGSGTVVPQGHELWDRNHNTIRASLVASPMSVRCQSDVRKVTREILVALFAIVVTIRVYAGASFSYITQHYVLLPCACAELSTSNPSLTSYRDSTPPAQDIESCFAMLVSDIERWCPGIAYDRIQGFRVRFDRFAWFIHRHPAAASTFETPQLVVYTFNISSTGRCLSSLDAASGSSVGVCNVELSRSSRTWHSLARRADPAVTDRSHRLFGRVWWPTEGRQGHDRQPIWLSPRSPIIGLLSTTEWAIG